MSLILEALRKSEAERRRGEAPDLRTELPPLPVQSRGAIPRWTWLLSAAVLVAMAMWLMRSPARPDPAIPVPAGANQDAHADAATATMPPVPRLLPAPAPTTLPAPMRTNERTTSAVNAPMPTAASALPDIAPPKPIAAPAPMGTATTSVATTIAPTPTANDDVLQLADLPADERKSLPPLKMSMHLWNADPARRFVIVDGNRVVEGDRLGDAVVTAITADGVMLDWNGRRLKLPIR